MATQGKCRTWMISTGTTFSLTIILPLTQAFSLLYRDTLVGMDLTGTQISFILCTAVCTSSSTSAIIDALIKKFGYRKIGFLGGCLVSLGFISITYSTKYEHFILSYGLVTAFGIGMAFQAFTSASNAYFANTNIKAYIWTISGLGPILMPRIIVFLQDQYDITFGTRIMAAFIAVISPMALLLQPIEYHKKPLVTKKQSPKDETVPFLELKNVECLDKDTKLTKEDQKEHTFPENGPEDTVISGSKVNEDFSTITDTNLAQEERNQNKEPKETSCISKILKSTVDTVDRTLLKDLIFVNIIFGLSWDYVSANSYVILLPFIMLDKHLDIGEIATIISSMSIAEIMVRLLAPLLANVFKLREKFIFVITLIGLICALSAMFFVFKFLPLLICAVVIGALKGIRATYWMSIILNHVSVEQLPNALDLQNTINGVHMLTGGYIIGLVKDLTGSYMNCIHVMNLMSLVPVLTWTIETVYRRSKTKGNSNETTNSIQ